MNWHKFRMNIENIGNFRKTITRKLEKKQESKKIYKQIKITIHIKY